MVQLGASGCGGRRVSSQAANPRQFLSYCKLYADTQTFFLSLVFKPLHLPPTLAGGQGLKHSDTDRKHVCQ